MRVKMARTMAMMARKMARTAAKVSKHELI
jgi:hypothetical protein